MGEEENGDDVSHTEEDDDDVDDLSPRKLSVKKVLVSQEVAELLSKGAARGSLGVSPCNISLVDLQLRKEPKVFFFFYLRVYMLTHIS